MKALLRAHGSLFQLLHPPNFFSPKGVLALGVRVAVGYEGTRDSRDMGGSRCAPYPR